MKFSLFQKIFSAFMVTILAAIALLALVMYFSANKRFSDYVIKVELKQLDDLVNALGSVYQERHSWDQFRQNPGFWHRFMWVYLPEMQGYSFPPPGRHPSAAHKEKAGSSGDASDRPEKGYLHELGETGGLSAAPPIPPPPPRESLGPRVALFDQDRQLVVGPPVFPVRAYVLRPITVNEQTVGMVGLMPLRHGAHPLEADFVREQIRAFSLAGLCVLVLAGFIAYFLSRHFLAPIKKLTEAAKELSSLHFGAQIPVKTNDELGQLANAFNTMAKALEKNEILRKQWTSDVAHELRTPLAILRGEIEAMQDGIREITGERLVSLHEEINRIGKIVDDLHVLFVADSENLVQKKEPVKPLEIFREVLATFETRLSQAGIKIEDHSIEDQSAQILGDKDRLAQLFVNLIENSIRYTDSPGILRISHYCSREKLTLVFEDSSPGVPSEALDRIFDRLYRVDGSRSRALGGSGLGLSICREIVIGHGGDVRASHSSLGGLLISIEFQLIEA